ncbi:hypothetical protein [Candidatus Nitrosocosmicus sp. T]
MLRSKKTKSLFLQTTLIALLSFIFTFTFTGSDPSLAVNFGFAQLSTNNSIIQIISTSTFIDDFGNFHVIGEVNNTSSDPQTNILITTILSDTTNNAIIGNHSAFSSIGTLRSGELSPFDILIPDPQIVGKFNFIEFSTSSQPATIEKPANLVLNGSSAFLDNIGNPHITGNIINQGPSPEQFLNLVATFYDNSSLGIVGTQSFGLNVANLTQNQIAPFDITITDNKTKSQAAFYSLNVDSVQNSMGFPLNPKFSFEPIDGFVDSGLFLDSPLNNDLGFTNNDNINNGLNNPGNDSDNDNQNNNDNGDNQRGEEKTDDSGNPYYNDENCSESTGSSGGNSSECQDAENEEQSEQEDEDSSETDQGPPSNSDSAGGNSDEGDGTSNESDGGENTNSNEENDNIDNSNNN